MKGFIKTFKNENAKNIDLKLINREYEEDLLTFVLDVFRSLESVPYIKFLDHSEEYDESKIDFDRYIVSRKKKKRDKHTKYQYIKPDRAFEVTMRFKLKVGEDSKIIERKILLYKVDPDNYIQLKGNKYFLLYQLLDSSTYVTKRGLTMKSLMPIIINYRDKQTTLTDLDGNKYNITPYYMLVFKREISVLLFFLCRMGLEDTLKYFLVDRIIEVIPRSTETIYKTNYVYFNINKHLAIGVNRHFWDKFLFVQVITAMLLECFSIKTNVDNLNDKVYWLDRLGSFYTVAKHKRIDSGKGSLMRFERLLDLTTKKKLKVSALNKETVYSIVRWIIMNFTDLRNKNNMDLNTKRLRLNEYVASMLQIRLGDGIRRVMAYGNKVTLAQVESNIFNFNGNLILQILQNSELLTYNDLSNDLDFFSKIRYTVKGPNSIGSGKSERNISIKYRGIDPSYIGNLDINVYSSSSPGLNGSLSPFVKTKNLYFNEDNEPQKVMYELDKEIVSESEKTGNEVVSIGNDTDSSYYDAIYKMKQHFKNTFKMTRILDPDILTLSLDDKEEYEIL